MKIEGREDVVPFENGLGTVSTGLSESACQSSRQQKAQVDGGRVSFLCRTICQAGTCSPDTVTEDTAKLHS